MQVKNRNVKSYLNLMTSEIGNIQNSIISKLKVSIFGTIKIRWHQNLITLKIKDVNMVASEIDIVEIPYYRN